MKKTRTEDTSSLHFEEIGDVQVVRTNRARRVSISIRPRSGIRVTLPGHVSLSMAEKFLAEKKIWIKKHLDKVRVIENKQTIFTGMEPFKTRYHTLNITDHPRTTLRIQVIDKQIKIRYPNGIDIKHPKVQKAVRKGIEEAWRLEALHVIPARVREYAEKHGFTYNRVFIKNIKSRWGSCSYVNNLNFSLHLMMLPDHLVNYVILHELAHTVHKNHGKKFWECLESLQKDSRKLSRELNNYRIGFY